MKKTIHPLRSPLRETIKIRLSRTGGEGKRDVGNQDLRDRVLRRSSFRQGPGGLLRIEKAWLCLFALRHPPQEIRRAILGPELLGRDPWGLGPVFTLVGE